jgi:hypothetical protein
MRSFGCREIPPVIGTTCHVHTSRSCPGFCTGHVQCLYGSRPTSRPHFEVVLGELGDAKLWVPRDPPSDRDHLVTSTRPGHVPWVCTGHVRHVRILYGSRPVFVRGTSQITSRGSTRFGCREMPPVIGTTWSRPGHVQCFCTGHVQNTSRVCTDHLQVTSRVCTGRVPQHVQCLYESRPESVRDHLPPDTASARTSKLTRSHPDEHLT